MHNERTKKMSDELQHVHVTSEGVASYEMTPPHPPRIETPAYHKTHDYLINKMDKPCDVCGVKKSTLGDATQNPFGAKDIETHHYPIERSLMDACDPDKVHKQFPEVIDQATLEAFVDSPRNMLVLCLTGDAPVLMASGKEKSIMDIQVGEKVIGHDLRSHRVTATMSREIHENIVLINGVRMTANHPVLTQSGWIPAGTLTGSELIYMVKVIQPHMLRMVIDKFKIFNPIICFYAILMMNTLIWLQFSTKKLFHNIAVFKHSNKLSIFPNLTALVPFRANTDVDKSFGARTRLSVKKFQPTDVATEFSSFSKRSGNTLFFTTLNASKRFLSSIYCLAMNTATFIATGAISKRDILRNKEQASTYNAQFFNFCKFFMLTGRWSSITHLEKFPFDGCVYDISVAHSRSFVTNGLAVHNCDVCHRSTERGIHHLLTQDFAIQKYLYNGYHVASTLQHKDEYAKLDDAIEIQHHMESNDEKESNQN